MKHRLLSLITGLVSCVTVQAQTVSNVRATFTDCHIEVKYDLTTSKPVDLTLKYSGDDGKTWISCGTVTGNITNQGAGNNKLIIWDNEADNIRWGLFEFRVEAPQPIVNGCTVNSSLPVGKLTFMCYNLGADESMSIEKQMTYQAKSDTDPTVYGDLYQWGRRTDGHEKRNSNVITTLSTSDVPGHGNFIKNSSTNGDWRTPQNNNLWGAPKTPNDPCPQGWRVPTRAEWESIYGSTSGNTWVWNSTGTPGYKISPDGGTTFTLFLPAAGRHYNFSDNIAYTGEGGDYWSSTVIGTGSYHLYFQSSTFGVVSSVVERANGYSCRCVAE
jgi:uncharacterized protein (TIGR02145 family)